MNDAEALTRLLGIEHPIIQAPMAGVSTPVLAAAVSNAGGLGSLGLGASTATQARALIRETRSATDKPFNVNLFCHQPARRDPDAESAWLRLLAPLFDEVGGQPPAVLNEIYASFLVDDAMLQVLLDEKPPVVSFHFGLPTPAQLQALRSAGIRTLASATSPDEAARVEAAGIDAIVAQGIEAGGHRGLFDPAGADQRLGTLALLALLRSRSRLPIIAAGGLMDGRDINAALAAGAAAAQLGTAFILCPESSASAGYRRTLQSANARDTVLTTVISGRPARGLRTRFIRFAEQAGNPPAPAYPVTYDATKQLVALARDNDDFGVYWAGVEAPRARRLPAGELMRTLLTEMGR